MNYVTNILGFADISIFLIEIRKFCYIKKYTCRLHFGTKFLTFLTCFEYLSIALISIVLILMMSAKMATLAILKIKLWRHNFYP